MKFYSPKRLKISLIISTIYIIYIFNFEPSLSNTVSSRSIFRQIFDYALNIVIVTFALYIVLSVIAYLYSIIFKKNTKQNERPA